MQTTLGPLEQKILSEVWRQKTATVRSVLESLRAEKDIAYTTVMTIMTRLTEKKILQRRKEGKGYLYSPMKSKKNFLQNMIRNTVHSLVDRYGEEAMVAFLKETQTLSQKDRNDALEDLNS